jgi:iron complex transport system substrate-binding protein
MRKSCFWLYLLIMVILSLQLFACNNSKKDSKTITITDMVGDIVEVPKNPEKVAVLARSAVDMLVAFGLGEKITGIYYTIFDNEWAKILYPGIDNYHKYDYNTTIETYLTHKVELVFCPEQYLAENLREHGIPAVTVSQYGNPNYDNYVFYFADMIKQIWSDESISKKVESWKNGFIDIRNQITSALVNVPTTKTLYYVRGDKNNGITYTENTEKSVQNTICKYLRLEYASKDFKTSQPTAEAILQINPDYIIVGGVYQHAIINAAKTSATWQNLSAFTNNNVFNIGVGFVMFEQNGVELTVYLADLANKIYPEIFNFDVEKLLKETIKTYFGKELSDMDIYNMLHGLKCNGQPFV